MAKKPKKYALARRNHQANAVRILRRALADAANQGCLWPFWYLVTALRGPDSESPEARMAPKAHGTIPLRNACYPTRSQCPAFYASFGAASRRGWRPNDVRLTKSRGKAPDHWQRHIEDAIEVCHKAFGTTPAHERQD